MTVIAMSLATSAQAQDRYASAPSYDSRAPTPMATLTWPGKTAAPPAPVPTRYANDPGETPQARPTSLYDPPPPRWRAAETAPPPAPSLAPTPIQPAQQAADGAPPRRYSLARQYGVQPDPIALSPQFLASSPQADMAEPPPLPPPHTLGASSANMSSAAATSQLRQAQEAASDAQAGTLGN
jgi:hypothetical protein